MKKQLSYGARQALASLAMQSLRNQKPAPNGVKPETNAECFARMRREELASTGDISSYQLAVEDKDGTSSVKAGLRRIWSQSSEALRAMIDDQNPMTRVHMIDTGLRLPTASSPIELSPENIALATSQAESFLESKNLSEDDGQRLIAFVGIHMDANHYLDILNPRTWSMALSRLVELGVISTETPAQVQTEVEETISKLKADAFRDEAERQWFATFENIWLEWLDSMGKAWNFYPNQMQQRKALDLRMKLESYGDGRFDECRRRLTKSGVFQPGMLDGHEQLAERYEAGMSQQDYTREFTRLQFQG
jgi:hypothetical protein